MMQDLKQRVEELKQEEWQKPLSSADIKDIRYGIMEKCLDDDKPGDSGHLLLRILYNIDQAIEREAKLVEALKYYADDSHWKHIYSSGSALPSDRFKLWEKAQTTLRELGIE